ncbi:hypothetical protein OROMI_004103 [Orobanche minor]
MEIGSERPSIHRAGHSHRISEEISEFPHPFSERVGF